MEITAFTLWAPGLESLEDWQLWTDGRKQGENSPASPKLTFASPIAVRRLSQLTRMTVHASYILGLDAGELFFASSNGEINAQIKVNNAYAETGEVKPSVFSLSVFNAAPAQATILLKSRIPYSPVFSSRESIIQNLVLAGTAPLVSGRLDSSLLIYAEEKVPEQYQSLLPDFEQPMVLGIRLSSGGSWDFPASAIVSPESLIHHLVKEHSGKWAC